MSVHRLHVLETKKNILRMSFHSICDQENREISRKRTTVFSLNFFVLLLTVRALEYIAAHPYHEVKHVPTRV